MRRATVIVLAVLALALSGAGVAADTSYMPVAKDGVTLAPFEAHDVEQVYAAKSLRAMRLLGWNRGDQVDSWWDWQMGEAYTYEPWAAGYPGLESDAGAALRLVVAPLLRPELRQPAERGDGGGAGRRL